MINIENLKNAVSKEFSEKQKTNDVLINTMDLVILQKDKRYIIKDEQSFIIAGELLKMVHELDKKVTEHHAPMKKAADEVKRVILDAEKKARGDLIAAKGILSAAIGAWTKKKEEEARDKAKLEQDKIEQERIKAAQEKTERAQDLKEQGTPESIQQALNLEKEAEDILDSELPPVKIEQTVKVSGMKMQEYWKFQIVNESQIPREYMVPDEKKIGQIVRAMKDKTDIPGVKVWSETKASSTGK